MKHLVLTLGFVAIAAPPAGDEGGAFLPRYEAAPDVAKHFTALAAQRRAPRVRTEALVPDAGREKAIGQLVEVADQIVTIRVRVTPEQAAILRASGIRDVRDGRRDADAVLHDGWFYQSYVAVVGLDLSHVEGRGGRTVRLELAPTDRGRRVVVQAALTR